MVGVELQQFVDADGICDDRADEVGSVADEVELADDVHRFSGYLAARPLTVVIAVERLARGDEQRHCVQVIGRDAALLRPFAVIARHDADAHRFRQPDEVILLDVEWFDHQREVDESVREFFLDGVGIAREELDRQARVAAVQLGKEIGEDVHGMRFACADADTARKINRVILHLVFCLVDEREDFLGPLAQVHAVLCQNGAAARAREELLAELVFEVGNLARERRLRHMQHIGGFGHILFPGHGQEVR